MTYREVKRPDIIESIKVTFGGDVDIPSDTVTWVTGTTHSVNENSAFSLSLSATSLLGGVVNYHKVGGADAALFSLSGNTLSMTAKDFEIPSDNDGNNVYEVTIRAASTFGVVSGYSDRTFNVSVSNVGVSWTTNSINVGLNENDGSTTFNISSYATSGTAPYTFSKLNWGDSSFFNVSSNGIISLVAPLDFEGANDANHDNIYTFKVRATDAQGEINDVTINVTLSDVGVYWNSPSIDVGIYESDEATTFNITSYATGGTTPYTFTKINGGDSSFFNVSSNGVISLVSALDYEGHNDANGDNVYTFQIRATDAQSETKDITVNVTLSDVATPSWTESPINRNVIETNSGYTLNLSTLVAGPGTKTYSLLNSGDYTKFSVTSGGTLSLVAPLDYDVPTDGNGDNVYTITVRVTNTSTNEYANVTVNITITDAPNPTWSANPITDSVDENEPYSIDLSTYLSSGTGSKTYTKSGADSALFSLNSSTGVLALISTKNYEAPTDANTNNVYTVNIRATDSVSEYGDTVFNLTVNNVPETTFFTITGWDIDDAISATSGSLSLSHGRVTFDVNDAIVFSDNGGDPRQKIVVADDDGSATITLAATGGNITLGSTTGLSVSGNGTANITMTGSIANLNAAFEGLTLTLNTTELVINSSITIGISQYNTEHITWNTSPSQSVSENAQFSVTLSATGSEGGTPTFTITGGADAAKFSIVNGDLIMSAKNYEAPTDADTNNIYTVQVQATTEAGVDPYYVGGIAYRTFNVTVINVIISWSNPSSSYPENSPISIELDSFVSGGTAPYTFSIPSLYDYSGWSINTVSVEGLDDVHYLEHAAFDYESPTDSDHNNVYRVPVIAYDANSEPSNTYSIYIGISDVGPSWTGGTLGTTVSENSPLSFDITSHVGGGNAPYTYTLNAQYDYSGFSITDGVIEHDDSFNYESPTDGNGDNVYRLNVTATDADEESKSKDIYITVTNVDDIPDSITLSGTDVVLGTTNYIYHFESTPGGADSIHFGPNYNQRIQITGDGGTPYTEIHMETDTFINFGTTTGLTFTSGSNGDATVTFHGTLSSVNTALDSLYTANGGTTITITLNTNEDSKTINITRINPLYEVQKVVPTGGDMYIKVHINGTSGGVLIPENSTAQEIQTLLRANTYIVNGDGTLNNYTGLREYLGWGENLTVSGDWSTGFIILASNRGNLQTLSVRANSDPNSASRATVTVLENGDQEELIHLTGLDATSTTSILHLNSTPMYNGAVFGELITFGYNQRQCLQISGDRNTATLKLTSSTNAVLKLSQTTGLTVTGPGGAAYSLVNGATEVTMTGTIANVNAALNGMTLSNNTSPATIACILNQGVTYQTSTKTITITYEDRTEKQFIAICAGLFNDGILPYTYTYQELQANLANYSLGPGIQPTEGYFQFSFNNDTNTLINLSYTIANNSAAAYLQEQMRSKSVWTNLWGTSLTVTGDYENGFTVTASKNGDIPYQIQVSTNFARYKGITSVPATSATNSLTQGGSDSWTNLSAIEGEPDGYLGYNSSTRVNMSSPKTIEILFHNNNIDLPYYMTSPRTKKINGLVFYIACPSNTNDPTSFNDNSYINCGYLVCVNTGSSKTGFGMEGITNPVWSLLQDYYWETLGAGSSSDNWNFPNYTNGYDTLVTYDGLLFMIRPQFDIYQTPPQGTVYASIESARLKIHWEYPYYTKTFTLRQGSTP